MRRHHDRFDDQSHNHRAVRNRVRSRAAADAPVVHEWGGSLRDRRRPFSFTVGRRVGSRPRKDHQVGALPTGVTFVANTDGTATIGGTPATSKAGTYPLTLTANNGVAPNATQSLVLSVAQTPAFTSAATATATVGKVFSFKVATSGFPKPGLSATGTSGRVDLHGQRPGHRDHRGNPDGVGRDVHRRDRWRRARAERPTRT